MKLAMRIAAAAVLITIAATSMMKTNTKADDQFQTFLPLIQKSEEYPIFSLFPEPGQYEAAYGNEIEIWYSGVRNCSWAIARPIEPTDGAWSGFDIEPYHPGITSCDPQTGTLILVMQINAPIQFDQIEVAFHNEDGSFWLDRFNAHYEYR